MTDDPAKGFRLKDGRYIAGCPAGPGRPLTFADAESLWQECLSYFTWVHENPLYASQVISFQGEGNIIQVPKMRAMTLGAMFIHIGTNKETWGDYASNPAFSDVVTRVDGIIRAQKFEGASADLLNANIIARDLGLTDKSEHSGTIKVSNTPDENTRNIESKLAGIAAALGANAIPKELDAE